MWWLYTAFKTNFTIRISDEISNLLMKSHLIQYQNTAIALFLVTIIHTSIKINIGRRQSQHIIAYEALWKNWGEIKAPEIKACKGASKLVNFFCYIYLRGRPGVPFSYRVKANGRPFLLEPESTIVSAFK